MIKEDHQKAVQDLFREQIKGIDLSKITEFDKLQGDEHRDFCKFAHTTYTSPLFKEIVKNLIYAQVIFSVNHAANYDETTFGRATINGISLIDELFAKYAREYESKYLISGETFDKHQLISK